MNKIRLIRARLILAQELLEESDALPGAEGYSVEKVEDIVHHSRHEREALVVYLLLTCFDLLGQSRKYITFYEWLSSKKAEVLSEHKEAIGNLNSGSKDVIDNAKALHEYYNKLYGPTRAFYAGIENLPPGPLAHLLESISVSKRNPESLKPENKNTIFPALPINNVNKLKMSFLYSQRNAFTHNLSQKHTSSNPEMSCFMSNLDESHGQTQGASWTVWILDGKIFYGSSQECDSKYVYTTQGWPFVLFEVLYSAINEEFDRTKINLNFSVFDSDKNRFLPSIKHRDLPAFLEEHNGIKPRGWGL